MNVNFLEPMAIDRLNNGWAGERSGFDFIAPLGHITWQLVATCGVLGLQTGLPDSRDRRSYTEYNIHLKYIIHAEI